MNQQRGVPRGSIYDGCPKTAGGNGWPSNRDEENGWESSGANFWGIFDHRGNNERNHVIFEESRRKKRQIFTLNYKRKKNETGARQKMLMPPAKMRSEIPSSSNVSFWMRDIVAYRRYFLTNLDNLATSVTILSFRWYLFGFQKV